jgi:ABC-type phosphate transport system substrate-binding protein
MHPMRLSIMITLLAVIVAPTWLSAAETVIVNPKSTTTVLSEDQCRELFLGKKTTWDDGSKVVVVVLRNGPSHDGLMKLLSKSSSQFNIGWKKLVFTGKGSMPEQVDSEDEMASFVARTPGAIAFIDSGKVKDGVKPVPIK